MKLGSIKNITPSHLAKLQFFYHTDAKIGESIGVSRQAVCMVRKKFDIPILKNAKYKRNKMIIDLYDQGFTGSEIAKRANISIKTVYRVISHSRSKS